VRLTLLFATYQASPKRPRTGGNWNWEQRGNEEEQAQLSGTRPRAAKPTLPSTSRFLNRSTPALASLHQVCLSPSANCSHHPSGIYFYRPVSLPNPSTTSLAQISGQPFTTLFCIACPISTLFFRAWPLSLLPLLPLLLLPAPSYLISPQLPLVGLTIITLHTFVPHSIKNI
jgi:hypothetical protein